MWYLEKIEIEGFRGINEPLTIELSKGLNVLFGQNGAGKSSIMQGIHWCLTGKIPYFSGGDFAKEDALVNMFTSDHESSITLYFKDKERSVKITRTRAMKSTSSPGTQPLSIQTDGQILKGKLAESYLLDTLKVDSEEVIKEILPQEKVAEILSVKPAEQTKVIEDLLGAGELKDFAEALDPKRQIQNAKAEVNKRIEMLEHDKVQFTVGLRNQLETRRKSILSNFDEKDLTLASAENAATEIGALVDEIAASLSASSSEPMVMPSSPSSIAEYTEKIEDKLTKLERCRADALTKIQSQISKLQTLQRQLEMALEQIQKLSSQPVEALEREKTETDKKLSQLKEERTKLERILSTISSNRLSINATRRNLKEAEAQITTIISEFGDLDTQSKLITDLTAASSDINKKISNLSMKNQLIGIAVEYLEETPTDSCPVCNQTIDLKTVVSDLRTITKDELQEISLQRTTLAENDKKIDSIKQKKKNLSQLLEEKRNLLTSLERSHQTIRQLTETKIDNSTDINALYSGYESKHKEIEQNLHSLSTKITEISSAILTYKQLEKNKDTFAAQIRKELNLPSQTPFEDKLVNTIQTLTESQKPYEVTKEIDAAHGKVGKLKSVVDYLQAQSQLSDLEKELPKVTAEVKTLKTNVEELDQLDGQLKAIREAVVEYEKESVQQVLTNLEDEVNEYYSALVGHPYFSKLTVQIESEFPLQFAFRATNPDEGLSTSISTRFSQAQMNVAAIAIFLSNNKRTKSTLPLLILDDPTLSMDDDHKERLASLLNTIANSRQIIVATHDSPFLEFSKQHAKEMTIVEFKNWDTAGPEI